MLYGIIYDDIRQFEKENNFRCCLIIGKNTYGRLIDEMNVPYQYKLNNKSIEDFSYGGILGTLFGRYIVGGYMDFGYELTGSDLAEIRLLEGHYD